MTIKYSLVGTHSKRTPMAYTPYRLLFDSHLSQVSPEAGPDLLVFGYVHGFAQELEAIEKAQKANPSVRLVVVSEEPLWDSIWSGDFTRRKTIWQLSDRSISYTALNHVTSSIFCFENLPYFITTEDHYLARYAYLFRRNSQLSKTQLLSHWKSASYRAVFFAEKRLDEKFDKQHPAVNVRGLCRLRSQIAQAHEGPDVLRVGRGWSTGPARQKLPDWHLDKIAQLDRKVRILSALENTHQDHYVTEKLFDAYAVLGIPLYYAAPTHKAFNLVPESSIINLYDLTAEAAISVISQFTLIDEYADAYLEAQRQLAKLCSNARILRSERERVVAEVVNEFERILDGSA
jgi:hypothetical protein